MRICHLEVRNFRGINQAEIFLPNHAVLIGDNNTGKTSLLEAIDLALGPDRLNRLPPIDEHDFYQGRYLPPEPVGEEAGDGEEGPANDDMEAAPEVEEAPDEATEAEDAPIIRIDVTVVGLNDEQKAHFGDTMYPSGVPALTGLWSTC